jgi:hypothetical protein
MTDKRRPKKKGALEHGARDRAKAAVIKIFLSHSHRDRAIAEALADLFRTLFDERIRVEHSSDQTTGGGIPPGAQWLPWITERIRAADKTYVLLTPASLRTPWVLWEAGAAAGVALATKKSSPVVPIAFGIGDEDIPSPFVSTQLVHGDTVGPGGIDRLLRELNKELERPRSEKAFRLTTGNLLPGFVARVTQAVRDSAPVESLLASVPPGFRDLLAAHRSSGGSLALKNIVVEPA